ncbi:phosphotransferase family protein [Vibrio sp.]|nr:phosphotransferase family protein [Vibrio sp.]
MMNDIQTVLKDIPNFVGRDLAVKRINGGITNVNWCVSDQSNGEKFFVKLHGEGTENYINRATALKAATIAAGKGIGPGVLFYDEKMGVEVHEFLDAYRSCDILDVQDAKIRGNIMSAYHSVHQDLILEETNTGFQQLETLIKQAKQVCPTLPKDIETLIAHCYQAKAAIEASGIDLCGCYNDSYISNYMRNDAGVIKIIDWEYAANNDPYWDVGMFCIESFFDELSNIEGIIEMYNGKATSDLVARTYLYIGVALVRWGLWALSQQYVSSIAFDYGKYSQILLLRARKQILNENWAWSLSKV